MTYSIKNKINHFLYRMKWHYGKYLNLKVPVCVDLELSNYCNLKCSFCYHASKPPFKQGSMTYELAEETLLQAHKLGVDSIKYSFRGEPTLNKDIFEITRLGEGLNFTDTIINTNGNYKNEDISKALLNCKTIKVSLDTLNSKAYKVMRPGGNHNLVISNIDYLYDHRKGRLVLQFIRTDINKRENFYAVKKYWPEIEVVVKDLVGGRNEKSKSPEMSRQCCIQPFVRLIVLWNGDIIPCCVDFKEKLKVGNVKDGLGNVFNSLELSQLRTKLKKGDFNFEPCKSCSSFESYKGFRGKWNS